MKLMCTGQWINISLGQMKSTKIGTWTIYTQVIKHNIITAAIITQKSAHTHIHSEKE